MTPVFLPSEWILKVFGFKGEEAFHILKRLCNITISNRYHL